MQWSNAQAYDQFMGRWSRIAAQKFLTWLCLPNGLRWLDVGCGTGAFSQVVLQTSHPRALDCIDQSVELLAAALARLGGQATIVPGNAMHLPYEDRVFDVAASALVLNFVPEPLRMVTEMKRVVRNGGCVASYVWDFHGGGSVTQHIGRALDEHDPRRAEAAFTAQRAQTTSLAALKELFAAAGLRTVDEGSISVEVRFQNFEEYWFANNAFASPHARQIDSLAIDDKTKVKERVRASLPRSGGDTIEYIARINCVRGVVGN
jgi:ubiquinone/menaquinone biosynthesis C-methylase UbiE